MIFHLRFNASFRRFCGSRCSRSASTVPRPASCFNTGGEFPATPCRETSALVSDTGRWLFDTMAFSGVTTKFGTSADGPFTATPPNPPTNYDYVQVAASVDLPMYPTRPLSGPTATAAVAGRRAITTLPSGIFPFSPFTRAASPANASDPYGYRIGNDYTFRWGAPGNRTSCGTDATSANLS